MSTEKINFTVPPENDGSRIDHFLTSALEIDLSRSYVQKLVKKELVLVNGASVKSNHRLKENDTIELTIPEPEVLDVTPHDIPLEILFEDSSIAVINKQPGISVHPGAGTHGPTLVSALLFHLQDLSSIGGVERPGIVHRLDKDTAGVMVIAKNDKAHHALSTMFQERTVTKEYAALVWGAPPSEHRIIEKNLGRHSVYRHKMTVREDGRYAKTEYYLIKTWQTAEGTFSLLRVILHTGRTHQIRVHLASEGMPIVADPLYSKKVAPWSPPWLMLSSVLLGFSHPETGKQMEFRLPPPAHMQQFIDKLNSLE